MPLIHRQAKLADLPDIIKLLYEDELGSTHETNDQADKNYAKAFKKVNDDSNQYLMVVENDDKEIIATCHLTIMPSLTFKGSTRLQIEAVRVASKHREQKIGTWMLEQAIIYAKKNDATIIQLATNKKRPRAKHFYEKLGFIASHEGIKIYLND